MTTIINQTATIGLAIYKWEYSDTEIVQMIRMADMYPSTFLKDETPAVRGAESKNNDSYI